MSRRHFRVCRTGLSRSTIRAFGRRSHGKIRILSRCAGPMCACMLADLGADVIKVEAHEGEVARRIPPALPGHDTQIGYAQATVNRNKRSLTLDLRRDEGREIFLKLAARSDIIVQNFRPGTFEKWGVGY